MPARALGIFAKVSHHAEAGTAFLRLLESAVGAEPESYRQADETKLAAMAILQRHPELLFECRGGRVKDHYRREIKGSPYQILLGAGDTWALKQVHQFIIPKIADGAALAEAEFKAQFPHCPWPPTPDISEEMLYDDRNIAQIAAVKAQLQIIVAKITADPCTNGKATRAETTQAVADLCQIFASKEGEVIQTGLHFPLGIMKEIFKVYGAQVDSWNGGKLIFFSFNVIGSAAAAASAVDGQCYKYGLANLNMDQDPDRRNGLFCRHPKGIPVDKAPLAGKLGRTMFIEPYYGYSCFASTTSGIFDWYNKNGRVDSFSVPQIACCLPMTLLDNLWRTKAETIGSYYAATCREVNTSCDDHSMQCMTL